MSSTSAEVHAMLISALIHRGVDPAKARALSPWYFPTVSAMRSLLESNGFVVDTIETEYRPTELPRDIGAWVRTFGFAFLDAVADKEGAIQEVQNALEGVSRSEDGRYFVFY